ncbi:MAG: keto-deoxy-phosphogluconate aldolase, partial [Pseudomonadota bacterium]
MGILNIFEAATVIPVLEVSAIGQAAPLAAALHAGGLRVAEVTLRTDCALEAIAEMKKTAPSLIIGMGTIRTATGISASLDAGADFLVTPGTPLELLDALAKSGAPALPGVATLSEIMTAHA